MADEAVDAIIVGSGGGALAAAVTAAAAGLQVVVLEKADVIGGTTALSGGFMWIPGNPLLTERGQPDDLEAASRYVRAVVGNRLRPELTDAYLRRASEAVHFLVEQGAGRFQYLPLSDYKPDLDGASSGRSIAPAPFDARALGVKLELLRKPLGFMTAFGGMMLDSGDLPHMLAALRKPASFRHAAALTLRYARDRLLHGRAMRLTYGNALIARMLKRVLELGVDLRTGSPAAGLIVEKGRVTGVRTGAGKAIRARLGVLLAAGGFSRNPELVGRHFPYPSEMRTLCVSEATGDSLAMATTAGAAVETRHFQNFLGMPMSALRHPDGHVETYMHMSGIGRAKPGLICVDSNGRRFVNEAAPYNDFVHAMVAAAAVPAFFIFDHRHFRRYGAGLLRPPAWARRIGPFLRAGYLKRAPTLRALAEQIGISGEALEQTVDAYNAAAREGHDPEFGKGANVFDRGSGERESPYPNLGPVARPPFYALRFEPGNLGSYVGLRVDEAARVLDAEGKPIEGLYACGLDAASIFSGTYPGAGCSIGPSVVFGYIAGRELAAAAGRA